MTSKSKRMEVMTTSKSKKMEVITFLFQEGSVSGSGTGPGDPGSRGPAMPDPETFPYEWLGVRQYIYMPCFMSVIGKQIESCCEYLKEIHKINKNYFIFIRLPPFWKCGYKSCNVCDMIQILRSLLTKPLIIIMK